MEKENKVVRIAVRAIYQRAITPSMYIIDLKWDTWFKFLYGTPTERKDIVLDIVGTDNLSHLIREIVWIPLDGQEQLCVKDEALVVKELQK